MTEELPNIGSDKKSPYRCKRFWIYAVPSCLLILLLCIFAVLRFGNPQWSKHIYMFQVFVWEVEGTNADYDMKFLPVPKNYAGVWCMWYENGQMWARFDYAKKNGIGMEGWYESGQKSSEDRRHGEIVIVTCWYRNGKKSLRYSLKKGRYFGRAIRWSTNEELVASGTFRNGESWNGTFLKSGSRKLKTYKNGKCIKTEEISDKFEFDDK